MMLFHLLRKYRSKAILSKRGKELPGFRAEVFDLLLLIQNAMIYAKSRKIESIVCAANDNKSQFIAKDEPPGISRAKRAGSSALYLERLPEWDARSQ